MREEKLADARLWAARDVRLGQSSFLCSQSYWILLVAFFVLCFDLEIPAWSSCGVSLAFLLTHATLDAFRLSIMSNAGPRLAQDLAYSWYLWFEINTHRSPKPSPTTTHRISPMNIAHYQPGHALPGNPFISHPEGAESFIWLGERLMSAWSEKREARSLKSKPMRPIEHRASLKSSVTLQSGAWLV